MKNIIFNIYMAVVTLSILTGCGGSGSSSADPAAPVVIETPTILTGVFIDSAVEGLNFRTDTQSGTTNSAGEFTYLAGENITFSIGDIDFPVVIGQEQISPLDIFLVSNVDDTRVVNMARFLQTLDDDGLTSNGITITDEAHNQASGIVVDFSAEDFDEQVDSVVANSGALYTTLINAQEAIDHLNLTLGNMALERNCEADSSKIGYVGTFSTLEHGVSGQAEIIDNCTIEVTMFNFDGGAPNVVFYTGFNGNFSGSESFAIGEQINGRPYVNETIILELPDGKSVDDFNSLSVWCADFNVDFGSLEFKAP